MPNPGLRRPIWKPGTFSSAFEALRSAANHVPAIIDSAWSFLGAIARILAIGLSIAAAIYTYRELTRDTLIIEPISVTKQYSDDGITPEVMANRIKDALAEIEVSTQSIIEKESLSLRSAELSAPDIEVPGTKLGLKTLIEMARAIVPFLPQPKSVSGEVILTTTASTDRGASEVPPQNKVEKTEGKVQITLRIKRGAKPTEPITIYPRANTLEVVAQSAAEAILEQVNPYVLGAYWLEHSEPFSAANIAQRIVDDPFQDLAHRRAAYYLWGLALLLQKKDDEAITEYRKAIELDAKFAMGYYGWGDALRDEKKYDEAIAKFHDAIRLDRKFAIGYYGWAAALLDQDKYDEAISKFQRATELDPKFAEAYDGWGEALREQKKYDEAISKFQRTVELYPKYSWTYNHWGLALYEQSKYDEAISKYQKAVELDPKFAVAYSNLGYALNYQGEYDEAVSKFQKAIDLDPKFAEAYHGWGLALNYQEKYDEAVTKFQKATDLNPKFAEAYKAWGFALDGLGRRAEALQKYQKSDKLQ